MPNWNWTLGDEYGMPMLLQLAEFFWTFLVIVGEICDFYRASDPIRRVIAPREKE